MKVIYEPALVSVLKNSVEIGEKAAGRIMEVVKNYPDAVLVLPTGSTPIPMYQALVKKFMQDRTIDLSKVTVFNLDEYVGLTPDHPLSYSYYMKKLLYEKLDRIDASRSVNPGRRNIPSVRSGETAEKTAKKYEEQFQKAIKRTGRHRADLVVLGIGGAYPVKARDGNYDSLKGGHIGFNEPGSKVTDRTRVVKLTKKTKLDTSFRFMNLRHCSDIYGKEFSGKIPDRAITLGIADIMQSAEILLLANLEEKMPVMQKAYFEKPTSDFPATFLKYHENVHWILDQDAAGALPHYRTPWAVHGADIKWDRELMRKAVIEVLQAHPKITVKSLAIKHMAALHVGEDAIKKLAGLEKVKKETSKFIGNFISSKKLGILPKNSRIVIFSPHPDDDVIDMAATTRKLLENKNDIWVVYMVNGENSVRNTDPETRKIFKTLLKEYKNKFPGKRIGHTETEELLRRARVERRTEESRAAAKILGLKEGRLIFLDLPYYYHRGLVGVDPLDAEKDIYPVKELLLEIQPRHIFYSAEADPHGAHGLSADIIAKAMDWLLSFWNCSFWGYRGAYEEWPLYRPQDLVIVPFGRKEMRMKIRAIKAHRSQLDPVFPSFDRREFFERSRDRNRATGRLLSQLGDCKEKSCKFAEVFRKISQAQFLRTK